MNGDSNEAVIQGAALAMTAGLVAALVLGRPLAPAPALEAPKPTAVTLSVVEEPPPPPPAPPPPAPEQPPPPPLAAVSPLLPPPPPPRVHRIVRPHRPPPPHPAVQDTPPPPVMQPQSQAASRPVAQAPENHSAEAAYIGRLHQFVENHTRPPDSAAYRLTHPSGEVEIGFTLSRSGAVSDVRVIRSSGFAVIDQQGVTIVSGQRYPPMPADIYPGQPSHPFTVPVSIRWAGGASDL